MSTIPISVTLLTKDSARYLEQVLEPLARFSEVLVYDTGSTDQTLAIAARFANVVIKKGPFIGFGPTHNVASALARHDWIFSLDSDEVASKALIEEIAALALDEGTVYTVARENLFYGKVIRGCGWWPDRQYRLYCRLRCRFDEAQVHEQLQWRGMRVLPLLHPLRHYPYRDASELLSKMQLYTALFACQYRHDPRKKGSLSRALLHGLWAFCKSYLVKRGLFDGREGLILSLYNGQTAYYKYLKLMEVQQALASCLPKAHKTSDGERAS